MSKNKLLYLISERSFENMQKLSIAALVHHKEKKYFCFDSYFELTYLDIIKYSLEYLDIKDPENYRDVFYKYFKEIYDISVSGGIYTSNRKLIFDYWKDNNKQFLQDVMDTYTKFK